MANYDPNKRYSWKPEDVFQLNGEEFGIILNAMRAVLNTPEAATILMAHRANEAIENIMANAVNNGVIKEADAPKELKMIKGDKQ